MNYEEETTKKGNTANDWNKEEEHKRVVSWDLKRDLIIQTSVSEATEQAIGNDACIEQAKDLVQMVLQATEHDPLVVNVTEFYRHETIVDMVSGVVEYFNALVHEDTTGATEDQDTDPDTDTWESDDDDDECEKFVGGNE